ncbi:hypothetical protein [Bacillus sp. FSL M8-0326]|uniref:hypothetical protein n=1 Tax=Bacillus sp. FSL M8-0326 TaxID=2954557 RepID=UPI0030F8625E
MAALKGVKTLDMVDGEITKVAYEGSEYERVEGDAKVGDLVTSIYLTESGEFFECYDVDCDGDAVFDDGVCRGFALERSTYELFRKKHVRLKVGDYAKVVEDDGRWNVSKGDLVMVSDDDKSIRPFHCDILRGEFAGQLTWLRESDLVLATEAEVAEAKAKLAPKFSVGDYAKVVGNTHFSDIVGGAIVKITDLADEAGDLRFELVGDGDYDYAKPSSLEKVSAEEAKWAEIGRKVDEYKVGDIVAYDDPHWFKNKGFGKVCEDKGGLVRVVAVDRGGFNNVFYLAKKRVTLITPVEARFDRS